MDFHFLPFWLYKFLRKIWHAVRPKRTNTNVPPPQFVRVAYCVPRQAVIITTRHNDAENIWPIDWHTPLSFDPKLYCIAVTSTSYGAELIRQSGVFVINFVPATMQDEIFFLGSKSGKEIDKFKAAGIEKEEAKAIRSPRLVQTLGFLECKVKQIVETGDHTLFIADILYEEFHGNEPRLHHLDGSLGNLADTFEKK